jgi:SAM-dependent methyltransferase
MDEATQTRLAQLNREFYRRHAGAFSDSRGQPWPGFGRVLEQLPDRRPLRVLDVGCGNGRFAGLLAELLQPEQLQYLGIDGSAELLQLARARHAAAGAFLQHDFLREALPRGPFDLVALFGVLHHVPGERARRALIEACCAELDAGGLLALTFWRYDRDARLARKRIEPAMLEPPLEPDALEAGDHLLGFGDDASAVRYCHFADEREQTRLLARLPARIAARFDADGAGDQLNSYALLRRS